MSRRLPSKPNLLQLKHQAKNLLKAHHRRDRSVCDTLRLLHRFAGQPDEAILSAALTLAEAQYALAMDYGFESWPALRNHVAPALAARPEADARKSLRAYSYKAVTLGRQVRTGVINARSAEDAVGRMRRDGLIPMSLRRQEGAARESLAGPPKGHAAARQAIELILLSSVDASDREVSIAFGRPPFMTADGIAVTCDPCFVLRGPRQSVSAVPFPPEIGGPELLEALRDMSGDRRFGSGSVRVRNVLSIGQCLPDSIPRRMDLLFRSDGPSRPVSLKIMLPGSRRMTRGPLGKILAAIARERGRHDKIHVLIRPNLYGRRHVQEVAKALAERLGETQVAVLERSANILPNAPVVVAEAGEMALLLIKARIRGEETTAAFEAILSETLAVYVDRVGDTDQLWSCNPSTITDDNGELVGSVTPGALLMLYNEVREFREAVGN
jgi:hypothetical protein